METVKAVIAVPSYKRSDSRIFQKLSMLPLDSYIFVRSEEKGIYKAKLPKNLKIIELPKVSNIGETRRYMMEYFFRLGVNWVFMFDDDVSKVEMRVRIDNGKAWNAARIVEGAKTPPSIELPALHTWLEHAITYDLALSSPAMRFCRRFDYNLAINKRQCTGCVLVHVPTVVAVGNYESNSIVGCEDMAIQFELMNNGYNTGLLSFIEFDCPRVGEGKGGNNAIENTNLIERYESYIKLFLANVSDDKNLVVVKLTPKTKLPSIKFNWKNWNGRVVY